MRTMVPLLMIALSTAAYGGSADAVRGRDAQQNVRFVPKTRVEQAAFAVLERYSESELREIQGFFAPVVKKWMATGEKFAAEYAASADRNAVLAKYLPSARAAIADARGMKVPARYTARRDQYVATAEALCTMVGMYLRLDGKGGR